MQINLEKILVHANEKLTGISSATEREEQVQVFKRFLKIETERLRIRHRFGLGGGEISSGRSYLIDLVVCRACQLAASEINPYDGELNTCGIVALGGYGRRELAPFSDIDLLFLHAGRRSKNVKLFVEQVLYLLWDMGLTVGHSFRSVSDCVHMAKEDLHSRTAMAEARLITGNENLFRRLTSEINAEVFKSKRETNAFLEMMRLELEARYEKFGRAVCLQEPNVKESAGGLRDLHTLLWVGHARYGARGLDDLRAADCISGAEYSTLRRAYDFIARVRNEAHFSTGRKTDLLSLDLQPTIASNLGYGPKRGLLASELFMRDYYQRAQDLHRISEGFLLRAMESRSGKRRFGQRARLVRASFEVRKGKFYLTIKKVQQTHSDTASYEVKQGKLYLKEDPIDFHGSPAALMEVFPVAQSERVDLSEDLKLAVRNNLSLVDRRFRASEEAGRAFVEVLRQKGRVASTLRLMHETGFLGRLLPEFSRITFLVQHDFYHKYTIDEHTLKAVEALDHLVTADNPKLARFSKVFAEVQDSAPLYLGLLLHDIGKGHGGGHVQRGVRIAERVSDRLRLDHTAAEQVIFLVRQHLLMSHLSQRRDVSEEGLIEGFVAKVGSLDCLNMLLLLTYADTNGVGPEVWNDWKATLLWELYTRARAHMVGSRPARLDWNHKTLIKQSVMRELLPEFLPSEVERHFAMMPERYIRATSPDQMVRHFRLTKQIATDSLIADWEMAADKHCTELTICTRDSAGLFARMAGTLTAHGVNILNADVYTREDGVVLDTFKISQIGGHHPVKAEQWSRIEQGLRAAIEGRYDVAAGVESWRTKLGRRPKRRGFHASLQPAVRFDSEVSAASTVIEVKAEDEPGLVYKIASTLTALDLDISFARITTEKSLALDIFYVTDSAGEKLAPNVLPVVESALLEALGGGSNTKLVKEAV